MIRLSPQAPRVIDVVDYRLHLGRPLSRGEASHLRGFFGREYGDELFLHHHHPDGSLHYDYPRVQFKVLDRTAHLIGIGEGCDLVTRLWGDVDQAKMGEESLPVLEAALVRRREPFGETAAAVVYRLRTPWLALNQENYAQYHSQSQASERTALLGRILVGNCLSLAKAFGHRVMTRLTADAGDLRPRPAHLKGVDMLGFVGTFRINFDLPDRIGIGKSVSRGFGTVERVELLTTSTRNASC